MGLEFTGAVCGDKVGRQGMGNGVYFLRPREHDQEDMRQGAGNGTECRGTNGARERGDEGHI